MTKKNKGKIQNFIKSTKTNNPTSHLGATCLSPIADSFMYVETSSNNHGNNVFVSLEITDIIQITIIAFYYNGVLILIDDSLKIMGRYRIQLCLEDSTWSTRYNIPKNDRYSNSPTQWTKLSLNFTVENYDKKLVYDEIDSVYANMGFSNITITNSVF